MSFLRHFSQSDFDLVGANGQIKGSYKGIVEDGNVQTEDTSIDAVPGDEIRRKIPNGREEVFEVVSSMYHEQFHGIDAHFIIKTRRKGLMDRGTGGNYVRVHGNNARILIGSTDNSVSISSGMTALFSEVREAIAKVENSDVRDRANEAAGKMERALHSQERLEAYQSLIATLANHITIITPFLPVLTSLLSSGA